MDDNDIMPWGIHMGKKMANVPPNYLLWCYENNKCSGEVRQYIKENLDVIKTEIERQKKKE